MKRASIFIMVCMVLLQVAFSQVFFSQLETISTRLHPNQDIIGSITKLLAPYQLTAISIASAVGSVKYCWLRFANNSYLTYVEGPLEITSLSGTLDYYMQPHIHIQLANGKGESIGGHLPSLQERGWDLKDCPLFTTLEIVFLSHTDLIYERKIDPQTTYHQLFIRPRRQHPNQ